MEKKIFQFHKVMNLFIIFNFFFLKICKSEKNRHLTGSELTTTQSIICYILGQLSYLNKDSFNVTKKKYLNFQRRGGIKLKKNTLSKFLIKNKTMKGFFL